MIGFELRCNFTQMTSFEIFEAYFRIVIRLLTFLCEVPFLKSVIIRGLNFIAIIIENWPQLCTCNA